MNCKPGDMALIIHSQADNEGKVVTCLEIVPSGMAHYGDNHEIWLAPDLGIWWRVDRNLNMYIVYDNGVEFMEPDHSPFCLDHALRPINGLPDKELEDESLSSPLQNALVQ